MITCTFSPCRRYRYTWEHTWDRMLPPCAFIGLNPSTADERGPDPTVRRCIGFARDWGYGRLVMLNVFAFRATDPKAMKAEPEPEGPENDRTLQHQAFRVYADNGIVVAAWGVHGLHRKRARDVLKLLRMVGVPLYCLKVTQGGEPQHPLYLRADLRPRLLHFDHAYASDRRARGVRDGNPEGGSRDAAA